jgi:hypothetical protein
MNATTAVGALALLAFVGYYYYRLVTTTQFNRRNLWLMPIVVGFFTATNVPQGLLADGREIEPALVSLALGLATGIFQSYFITLYRDPSGVTWQKGSWTAALVVLVTLPIRFGLRYVLFGGSIFAAGTMDKEVMFGYLVLFLALLVGRAVGLIARHPMLLEEILA